MGYHVAIVEPLCGAHHVGVPGAPAVSAVPVAEVDLRCFRQSTARINSKAPRLTTGRCWTMLYRHHRDVPAMIYTIGGAGAFAAGKHVITENPLKHCCRGRRHDRRR
jgi:hypothetical protein